MAAKPTPRPTLKTISELSGFAVPTVSRALKGAPDIGTATRDKVRKIAREIGYVPDRAGLRLRTGKTNVISLVLPTDLDIMTHTARLISSLAGALRNTNYHLIVTPYDADEDPMTPVRYIVDTRSADAVILNQTEPRDPRVAFLMERGFPFVTHGRTDWSDRHAYVDFDNRLYGRFGVERCAARGRKHILMVAPPRTQTYAGLMIDGATDAARAHDVELIHLAGATSDDPSDHIRHAVRDHLTAHPETDGILSASTTAAMASVAALEDQRRHVAKDIDVVCKEAVDFLTLFRPGIISVKEDVMRAGRLLAKAAIQAIDQPEAPPLQELDFPS